MSCSPSDLPEDAHQATQSSVLLLLQEATKLAAPADAESLSSGENPDVTDSGSELSGPFSVLRRSDRSSAWEVMCLINQQCERLLRSGREDAGPAHLDSSDVTESAAPSRATHCPAVTDACVSIAFVYSSELTDLEETRDAEGLAELIKTNTEDEVSAGENTSTPDAEGPVDQSESAVPPAGRDSPLDFTSCLVSEREEESAWLRLKADLNNNVLSQEPQEPPSRDARRRTQRKQPRPARSPDPRDADVQGVTFSMCPELEAGADRSRLIITSNYSEEIRRLRSSRSRSRSQQTPQRSSSSEEESDCSALARGKICASCRTRKTPLWRDAEDGTPLCNACGIRYKKYRVRCQQCWNIPKKDANTHAQCLRCGDVLKLKSGGW